MLHELITAQYHSNLGDRPVFDLTPNFHFRRNDTIAPNHHAIHRQTAQLFDLI